MFDIGPIEIFLVAVVALIVVGPKELPALLRSVGGIVRKARGVAREFRRGLDTLAEEVERETDPFAEERRQEGLTPGMSPEEITETILEKRRSEAMEKHSGDETEQTVDKNAENKNKDGTA